LTWFTRAWSITTPNLPNANEDQAYGPVQVTMSEPAACTWSIYAPNAPWLSIDANSGEISGYCPLGAPALITVQVIATQSPTVSIDKWFLLAVTPKPPPTTVSVSGPAFVSEGNAPLLDPAPLVTFTLNQLFSADVVIEVQYIDGTAFRGTDYASPIRQAVILAGHWSVNIPLCIFGDTVVGNAQRAFTVSAVVLIPNVYVSATAGQCVVTILEDDPAQPRHAIVRDLRVRESASQLADSTHVMANQPVFAWTFGSDYPGEVQTGWQVQVFANAAFTGSPVWDSGSQTGADSEIQLGAVGGVISLSDGTHYFARVRLWSSPTEISDWLPLALRTNTPPPAAILDSPSGNVLLSRPTLKWETAADAEDDARHFKVTLTGAATLVLDSSSQPQLFERYLTATGQWVAFGQAGADDGVSKVRMTVPLGFALTAGSWDWTVETNDGFESTAAAGGALTINVQPAYAVSGKVLNNGIPDIGRMVSAYRMPGHTLLGSNFTNSSGEFIIPLGGSLVVGDVIALVIGNLSSPPPAYTPAYAASLVRFAGADLVDVSGQNRSVELRHGRIDLDPRGQDAFTLATLIDTSGDSDWPVAVIAGKLVLRSEMTGIDLQGTLAVLGTAAALGEPTVLSLPGTSQEIRVNLGGALLVQDAASVETQVLTNGGCVSLESGSTLNLSAASTSSGQFVMQSGATLVLDNAQLTITGGYPQFLSADIHGVTGHETVLVQGGALSASGTGFHGVRLDIGANGDVTDLNGAVFDGATDCRISWYRQRDINATLRGIRFETGSTYNIAASADADKLTLIGCGGDLAGEAFDSDPGEATAQDIVNWVLSTISDSRAIAGDTRVLLVWDAGEQTGGGFTYNIHASATPGGQITLVGTTQDSFYVENNLPNGTPRYYYVELSAWGTHSTWSPMLEATPQLPALTSAFPVALRENGTAAGLAEGSATHFKSSSTAITSPQNGVSVPASSIDVIGDSLILFDVETSAAALGMVDLDLTTPDVWAEHGAPGYAEIVSFQAEVKPPATPNYPSAAFVQTGGAVAPDALTDGAFAVSVEFNAAGGAEINAQSFECVVDRDIMVGGQVVAAGTNLAGTQFGLWGSVSATGATWQVDQIQVTTDPQEEFISRGELIISVRVGNAFGFTTPWNPMRIHVQGGDPDYAITTGIVEPGKTNQLVVRAACLVDTAYEVQFPQGSGITVQSVTTQTSGGISLEVTCSATANTPIGSDSYSVVETSSQQVVATGVYHTKYLYDSLYASHVAGAGPRAATAAVNVILQTGDFFWSETDLATKARAFPIVWSRTYQSRKMARRDTPLGKGWYGTYFQKVEIGSNTLRWLTASGEDVLFENPSSSGGETTWQCPPGYNVTAVTKTVGVNDECIITTSDGTRLRFQEGVWISNCLKLREVRDPKLNLHVLEYDWTDERLTAIRGDTWGSGVSECLLLSYYKYGRNLLRTVERVLAVKDGATSAPLDTVRYYYSWEQGLTLQRIPEGDRFSGHLYRGYTYDDPQAWNAAQRMIQVFPPSQTEPDATLDPQDLNEWECEVETGGTQAPVPGLTINYDPNTGRVESQVLGPVGGTSERRYAIAYNSGPPVERTVTPPSGSASNVKYELNDDGQATKVTLDVPSPQGSGTVEAITEYEFEPLTQNLLMMKEPKGSCTYYTYAPGSTAVTSGAFWNLTPSSTQTQLSVPPGLISAGAIGWVVKLFGLGQGGLRERYYIVAPGTTDGLLVVGANLLNDGWITGSSGIFALFNLNTNALSRSLLVQERRCAGSGWASSRFVRGSALPRQTAPLATTLPST
jgi:hypothetical protein